MGGRGRDFLNQEGQRAAVTEGVDRSEEPQSRHLCPHCSAIYRSAFDRCPRDGSALVPATHDPMLGRVLGERYEIERCVGEGAMGRVYLAKHVRMSRRFAVKVLFGDLAASPVMRSRFAREAETASRLEHPNLIQVVDFGESEQGLLYLVMSFVEGRTLERIVRDQGALSQPMVIELAKGLCRGLRHAHMRGLVHRDFKPENVIVVVEDGVETPKIVDFGVALDAGGEGQSARLTRAGHIVGTPAFMSPEQALAEDLDARSDLFSFGLVLYNLLTGLTPWDARGVDVLAVMITQPAPPMAERNPEVQVSPGLEAIVMRLLEKDRDERFASAEEVLEALDELSDVQSSSPAAHAVTRELPMHVLSTGEAEALGQWRSRRALWLGLTGLVMIAAAAVFVVTLPGTLDPGGSEPAADVFNVEPLIDSAAVVPLPASPKPSIVPPRSVADAVGSGADDSTVEDPAPATAGASVVVPKSLAAEVGSGADDSRVEDPPPVVPSRVRRSAEPPAARLPPPVSAPRVAAKPPPERKRAPAASAPEPRSPAAARPVAPPAATHTDVPSVDELKWRYEAVGAAIARLSKERGAPAAEPHRTAYFAVSFAHALRVPEARKDAVAQLIRIERAVRDALAER